MAGTETAGRLRSVPLDPKQARMLLDTVDARLIGKTLERAQRVIAAREETIDILRLEPAEKRMPRMRGPLSAFRWPRATDGFDSVLIDRLAESGLFLGAWYRSRHADAITGDPWAHYLAVGLAAGFAPNPFFDPGWYADRYLDGHHDEPAILHYVRAGARYALATGPLFDAAAYLVADGGLTAEPDPLAHFITRGIDEGRAAIPVRD